MRRSHDGIQLVQSVECPNCGERRLPHHVCNACGWYDKKQIIDVVKNTEESTED